MAISSHRQPQPIRRRRRPRLEQLEDRLAPALYTVTTLADENNGIGVGGVSLREALGVGDADTIDFAVTGTINLESALPNLSGNLSILGPGASNLTVRRNVPTGFGIFNVISGSDVELAGMTIQNGHNSSGSGGGVSSTNARLTLTDCVLEDNRAFGNGGGLFFLGNGTNTLTITGCIIQDNTGESNGSGAWVASPTSSGAITVTVSDSAFLRNNDGTGGSVGGLALIGGNGSTLNIIDTNFTDNLGRGGSAGGLLIANESAATVTVAGCTFTRNRGVHGGGMNVGGNAHLSVTDCLFEDNIQEGAGNGGGLTVQMSPLFAGSIDVRRTQFLGNSSSSFGGGMAVTNGPTVFITDCTFAANTVPTEGGGFYSPHAVSIVRSTFHGNSAGRDGGGLYAPGSFSLPSTIANSTFSNNSAGRDAGGLYATTNYTITHTTVTANRSDSDGNDIGIGGGLRGGSSTLLHHTLIAGNFDGVGSAPGDVGANLDSNGTCNLIGDDTGMSVGPFRLNDGVNGNQVGTSANPIDPVLGPLANNGGLTLTHALLPGSPALDAGNNAIVTAATDQRGSPRIVDGDDPDATPTVDIGAYESVPVNDPPTAVDDTAAGPEDQDLIVAVLSNDTDPDGDPLVITAVSAPAHGTAVVTANGTIIYRGDLNYFGGDSFTYVVTDGHGHFAEAAVVLTIDPVNDAPVAVDDSASVSEDNIAFIALLANDSDADNDLLAFDIVTGPAVGSLLTFADSVGYIPPPDFNGTVTFTYRASDGVADSNLATVTVHVTSVNDLPIAHPNSYTIDEDQTLNVNGPGVLDNDVDVDGDQLIVRLVSGPGHGAIQLNPDGSFNYTPAANYHGPDSFTYLANDGTGDSNPTTVSLTIALINDPPVITSNGGGDSASLSVPENATAVTTVAAVDADGDAIAFAISGGADAGLFAIDPTTGALRFLSAPDYEAPADADGDNIYEVRVQASDGTLTDTQALAVEVTNVADGDPGSGCRVYVRCNTLYIIGDQTDNVVHVVANDAGVQVTCDGGPAQFFTGIAKVMVRLHQGNDQMTVHIPPPDPETATALDFDVRLGQGDDRFDARQIPPPDPDMPQGPLGLRMNVQGGMGDDLLNLVAESLHSNGSEVRVQMNGGNGNDGISVLSSVTARMGIQPTPFLPDLLTDIQIDGGAGSDGISVLSRITAAMGIQPTPFLPTVTTRWDVRGGAGADIISMLSEINAVMGVEPTVFFPILKNHVNVNGGAGDDRVSVNGEIDPAALVGFNPQPEPPILRVVVDGGSGNDVIDASFTSEATVEGADLNVALMGGAGDDILQLHWTAGAFDAFATANGGAGFDTGLFSPGVIHKTVERLL